MSNETENTIDKIASLLTDDPDIFNEMAVTTGGVAMGPGNVPIKTLSPNKTRKRKKRISDSDDVENKPIKKFHADPVTGQPKDGEILYSDTQSEDTDEALE